MFAWQFQKALHVAEKHEQTRFVSMQDHLNLLYREEEREMLPLCREEKIGVIPYSPLAYQKSAVQGAATSVLLAASPLIEGVSGRYFEDGNETGPHQPGIRRGVAAFAMDPENAVQLWNISLRMLNQA